MPLALEKSCLLELSCVETVYEPFLIFRWWWLHNWGDSGISQTSVPCSSDSLTRLLSAVALAAVNIGYHSFPLVPTGQCPCISSLHLHNKLVTANQRQEFIINLFSVKLIGVLEVGMELLGSSVTQTSPVYYLVIYSFLVSRSRFLAQQRISSQISSCWLILLWALTLLSATKSFIEFSGLKPRNRSLRRSPGTRPSCCLQVYCYLVWEADHDPEEVASLSLCHQTVSHKGARTETQSG